MVIHVKDTLVVDRLDVDRHLRDRASRVHRERQAILLFAARKPLHRCSEPLRPQWALQDPKEKLALEERVAQVGALLDVFGCAFGKFVQSSAKDNSILPDVVAPNVLEAGRVLLAKPVAGYVRARHTSL